MCCWAIWRAAVTRVTALISATTSLRPALTGHDFRLPNVILIDVLPQVRYSYWFGVYHLCIYKIA
jgi:hypothetical protein